MLNLRQSLCAPMLLVALGLMPANSHADTPARATVQAAARAVPITATAATTTRTSDLRVMSFNLRVPFRLDGFNYWDHRKDLLVETIRDFAPDVLGTQECINEQAWHIFEKLPNYGFVGAGRDNGKTGGEMTAIFYRIDKFRQVDSGHFWLSEKPESVGSKGWDAGWRRMASWVKLRSLADGRVFVVFNTHFDVWGDEARYNSALLIRKKIREIAGTLPAIITGDFNDAEGSPTYNALLAGPQRRGEPFVDTFREVYPRPLKGEGTRHGFGGSTNGPRIDWIFTTTGFDTVHASIDHTRDGSRYPSDHFPVTAVLRWDDREVIARASTPVRSASVGG